MGDLDFEDAVGVFAETVRAGAKAGADLVLIETMSDAYEAKAALLAARENCDLPVFVTCTFDGSGKLLTGGTVRSLVPMLEGLGADAVGINVTRYKYVATCIGSGIAGLGGLYYIIDYMVSQEAYLSLEAFGWLSIALVIFALWRPHMTIIGSTVFGILFSCSSYISNISWIQVTMATKPLMKMLPYVVTIIVLIISSIRNKRENQPPAALGLSYFREER